MTEPREVSIRYTNWRGETAWRRIVPGHLYFGEVSWHPGEQWLLDAFDVDKGAERTFAVADIHEWRPAGATIVDGRGTG